MRFVALVLAASGGALVLSACYSEPQHAHPPRPADLDAWRDVPTSQLQTQRRFAELQRDVRKAADGSEVWLYSSCDAARSDVRCFTSPKAGAASLAPGGSASCGVLTGESLLEKCCFHEFVVRGARVASYATEGTCEVGCGTWPRAKLYECMDHVRAETETAPTVGPPP